MPPSKPERQTSSTQTGSQSSPAFTCRGAGSRCLEQSPQCWQPAPRQILIRLRHSFHPSPLHALNVEAPSSPLASSSAEKSLGLYQYCRNANTAELSSWGRANRGTKCRDERQLSPAQLLNMVLLLWDHREPRVLLLGEGGGKGNVSCHLRRIWQGPLLATGSPIPPRQELWMEHTSLLRKTSSG